MGAFTQSLGCASAPDLTSDAEFTIAFWFKARLAGSPASAVSWNFVDEAAIAIAFEPGQEAAHISAETPELGCDSGNVIAQDVWHFAVVYFDGTGLYILIDDEEVASDLGSSTGIASQGSGIAMGTDYPAAMDVAIDELGYWVGENALTSEQRSQLYNSGAGIRPTM